MKSHLQLGLSQKLGKGVETWKLNLRHMTRATARTMTRATGPCMVPVSRAKTREVCHGALHDARPRAKTRLHGALHGACPRAKPRLEPGDDGIREKNGEKLIISGVVFDYQKATAELLAQQLAEVGVDLQITLASAANIGDEWRTGDHHFFLHANTGADPDLLRGWFSTSLTSEVRNFTDTSTNLDELLDLQPTLPNGAARDEVLADIQQIILENAFAVPIEQRTFVFAFRDDVHDVRLDAQASTRFYDAWKADGE